MILRNYLFVEFLFIYLFKGKSKIFFFFVEMLENIMRLNNTYLWSIYYVLEIGLRIEGIEVNKF